MLSQEERHEIEEELAGLPDRRAACIDAMRIVQRRRGWVSDESLRDIGELLEMSPAELDGIATFYNLIFRKPVGRHIIMVCDSVTCWMMGYDAVRERLARRLGAGLAQTTPDGRFTMLPIVCLGACDRAPALMVDDDLYGGVDLDEIDHILDRYE